MKRPTAIWFLVVVSVAMLLWVGTSRAADPGKDKVVAVGGILTTDGNKDSLMMLTDGEDTPVKYTFAESFDKKSLQGIFSITRILITYSQAGGERKLLSLKRATVPATAKVTGQVVYANDFFVAVKPSNGAPDGYALGQWPPGEMGNKLKSLKKGDTVTVQYRTDGERHRINTMDIVARAPAVNLPEGVKVQQDIEFAKVGDVSLRLDLYTPGKASGPLPLVVWIYGGAWMGGDKTRFPLASLATKGYVVASIEYRHTQVAIFPAQIEDAKAAIRFLRGNAGKYGIDPDHIGVWGESSGGHLAALLGVSGGVKELEGTEGQYLGVSSRVQAVVDSCGPADFPLFLKTLTPGATKPVEGLLGGLGDKVKDLAVKASPVHYASKDAAPFLIFHGDKDNTVPLGQSESLNAALKAAGADVTLEVLKGVGHGTMRPATITEGTAFMDKHLKKAPVGGAKD